MQEHKRRGELEAELAESQQVQSQLRQELQEAQQQLEALREKGTGVQELEARAQQLQAARAEVEMAGLGTFVRLRQRRP